MTQSGYLLLGLTAVVGALVAVLVFAVLRVGAAARKASRGARDGAAENAFLAAALQEAVAKLKERERASAARATASERLSGEIIVSMASGLLVVGLGGEVRILNPSGLQMLGLELIADDARFQTLLGASAPALVAAIEECLTSRHPIVRRAVDVQPAAGTAGATHLGVTVSPVLDESGVLQGAAAARSPDTANEASSPG
ncbi:MAG: hypothetical protein CL471_02070 [Acidobacteria bacterium]|nr:hypothetical protein [Acidobacteriota bacterium]